MNKKLTISLVVAMIVVIALGFIGPVSAETLRDLHSLRGITVPDSPKDSDCQGCHSSILKGGETDSIEAFHIEHVSNLGLSCSKCHKIDESDFYQRYNRTAGLCGDA